MITTKFDVSSWDQFGIQWLRAAKTSQQTGFILDYGLSSAATLKIKEFGFQVISYEQDFVDGIFSNLSQDQVCTYFSCEILPGSIPKNSKTLSSLVAPITNIQERVKIAKQIKTISDSRIITGTWEFWGQFSGLRSYLKEIKYFDYWSEDLLLNIFNVYFSKSLL